MIKDKNKMKKDQELSHLDIGEEQIIEEEETQTSDEINFNINLDSSNPKPRKRSTLNAAEGEKIFDEETINLTSKNTYKRDNYSSINDTAKYVPWSL